MEAIEAALFLRLAQTRLLQDHFAGASFAKSTGDGLLLVYDHGRDDLADTMGIATEASLRAVAEFPTLVDHPMVPEDHPRDLGIGIAHGPASALRTGDSTLDYFGRPLNLAARLMELARPRGVVIDDASVLVGVLKEQFSEDHVYIRGFAEASSRPIFVSDDIEVPSFAKIPIVEPIWHPLPERSFPYARIKEFAADNNRFILMMEEKPRGGDVLVEIMYPTIRANGRRVPNERMIEALGETDDFVLHQRGDQYGIAVMAERLVSILNEKCPRLRDNEQVTLGGFYPVIPSPDSPD